MNKQEAIEKIENLEGLTILDKTINFDSEMIPKKEVFNIINQIDEPEKPVVPQFVADWYEKNEYSLERNIYTLCIRSYQRELPKEEFSKWFDDARNKAIETLVKMKLYGYEVEKEKLYTVEIPNPNVFICLVLCKDCDGKLFVATFSGGDCWETFGKCKLTESEIKKDFEWAWQFAKEVKND